MTLEKSCTSFRKLIICGLGFAARSWREKIVELLYLYKCTATPSLPGLTGALPSVFQKVVSPLADHFYLLTQSLELSFLITVMGDLQSSDGAVLNRIGTNLTLLWIVDPKSRIRARIIRRKSFSPLEPCVHRQLRILSPISSPRMNERRPFDRLP